MIFYPRIWIAAHGGPKTVAQSEDTPPAILRLLAQDSDTEVRAAVAGNPKVPKEALMHLLVDEDFTVSSIAKLTVVDREEHGL